MKEGEIQWNPDEFLKAVKVKVLKMNCVLHRPLGASECSRSY